MKYIVIVARSLNSLFGIALLALGVLFWTGHAMSLLPLHMLLGGLFVITLLVLVVLGLVARNSRGLAVVALLWTLLVPAVGVAQLRLLPGADHWVIQVIHLLVGIVAMGLGHALARRIGKGPTQPAGIPASA